MELFEVLTESQRKIVQIILSEQASAKEIGAKLGISHLTVKKQLSFIYKRLGFKKESLLLMGIHLKSLQEELQKTKALYQDLHSEWLKLKTENWLAQETIKLRDREIAELKAKLENK